MIKYLFIILLFIPSFSFALPAFPGAEGHGSDTVGGRGGAVYIVDTLSDNPADGLTFREAVTATGARVVVFAISGTINLTSKLTISTPYLTIAGQTSPGGICITGNRTAVNTHDVVVRHIRFRIGSHGTADPDASRSFEVYGDGMYYPNAGYNIVVDHCSFSWAADTNVTVNSDAYNITFSWNIISDPLNVSDHPESPHGYGFLYWGKYTSAAPVRNYSLHHNYFAHSPGRVPDINYFGHLDAVNNVVFDTAGGRSAQVQPDDGADPLTVNFIHNYFKKGADNNATMYEARVTDNSGSYAGSGTIYMVGNLGANRTSQSDPEWSIGQSWTASLLDTSWQSLTPIYPSLVTATTMSEVYASTILNTVGATRPARDSVDASAVADFASGTSGYTDAADVVYPTSFPLLSGTVLVDADSDGMPDTWESANGTNPNVADDDVVIGSGDLAGYTNIEGYLSDLAGDIAPTISTISTGSYPLTQ